MSLVGVEDETVTMPSWSKADREGFAAFLLRMRAAGIDDASLISAFESVQRRGFVPAQFQSSAWSARVVPIACGEVIEGIDLQARLLHALRLSPKLRVLEIGTGSGYTAAVMARLAGRVYTTDRFKTLHLAARKRFAALKLDNVVASQADGARGGAEAPYDRIIAWGSFDAVPRPFAEQLVSGGEMICAIGRPEEVQVVHRLTKVGTRFEAEDIANVRFQPLQRGLAAAL